MKSNKPMSGLTPQQEKFAQAVAAGNTYADAYKEAYNTEKMAINTIYVKSSELMSDGKITVRVSELREEYRKRNQVTLDEVLKEMSEWLRFNVKTIFNEDGSMKQLAEMTDQEASSIASYECIELFGNNGDGKVQIGYLKKVKLLDKRAVADMFLKKFGAYIENHKVTVDNFDYLDDLLHQIKK